MKQNRHCRQFLACGALFLALLAEGCTGVESVVNDEGLPKAPAFELPDMAGDNVRLAEFEGKVVLLDLWATWCTPCLEGIPVYNELLEKYQGDGLEIIGIAVQSDFDAIQPIIDKYEIQYPILVGNKNVETAYRLIGFPTAFLIDRDGAIQHKLLGTTQLEGAEGEIRQMLDLEG